MLTRIAADIAAAGGRAYYVGGYVRDRLLGIDPAQGEDIDIEVFGLELDQLQSLLSSFGTARLVGKSFPVLLLSGHPEWDFTVPLEPGLNLAQACGRRDFTVNSMMIDILNGDIIDFYGGRADLARRIIRHTTPAVMAQDPLRAYRALHFAARFNFTIHPETLALISQTDLSQVKPERIFLELRKLLLLSARPSIGLHYMLTTGILARTHPLLFALTACPQAPASHPEGDVWAHTLQVVDQAAGLKTHSAHPEVIMLAALLHDLGKPSTTCVSGDRITTYGHDLQGEILARQFLADLTQPHRLIEAVARLVKEHMQPILLYRQGPTITDKAIRQLVNRVNLTDLLLLAEADLRGRGRERDFAAIRQWLLTRVAQLGLKPDVTIEPLVQGRDLIKLGLIPGPAYAAILAEAFDLQLEGQSKAAILAGIGARHGEPG